MEKLQVPKVGDLVFEGRWRDTICQARLIEVDEMESYAQLSLIDDGTIVWSSPKVDRNDHELAFGTWYEGNGLPLSFDDIDGDGFPELLAPVPKADLTPTEFRVFRWDGHQLQLVRKAALVRSDEDSDGFSWTEVDPEEFGPLVWIDDLEGAIAHVVHRRRATVTRRTLSVAATPTGFAAAAP